MATRRNRYGTRDSGTSTERSRQSTTRGRSDCPICNGSGYEIYERDGEEVFVDNDGVKRPIGVPGLKYSFARRCPNCNGAEQVAMEQRERSQIPATFCDAMMSDFDWDIYKDEQGNAIDLRQHRKMIASFLEKFDEWRRDNMGLYIWSATRGCGKTFLASAICNELIAGKKCRPKFVSASDLIGIDKEDDPSRLNELMEADVLVLDDLGQQNNGNKWLEDILFRILDYRMQAGLMVIVTSNVRIGQLNFDDRVADRLNDLTYEIPLPDFCVRSRGSQRKKRDLMTRLRIIGKNKADNEEPSGQMSMLGRTAP